MPNGHGDDELVRAGLGDDRFETLPLRVRGSHIGATEHVRDARLLFGRPVTLETTSVTASPPHRPGCPSLPRPAPRLRRADGRRRRSPEVPPSADGHSSIRVTLDLYGHLFSDANRGVLESLDALTSPSTPHRANAPKATSNEKVPASGDFEDGSDGTRTRDLRRDRLVPRKRRLATIDAQSLYSCGSAGSSVRFPHDCTGSISSVCCPSAARGARHSACVCRPSLWWIRSPRRTSCGVRLFGSACKSARCERPT